MNPGRSSEMPTANVRPFMAGCGKSQISKGAEEGKYTITVLAITYSPNQGTNNLAYYVTLKEGSTRMLLRSNEAEPEGDLRLHSTLNPAAVEVL